MSKKLSLLAFLNSLILIVLIILGLSSPLQAAPGDPRIDHFESLRVSGVEFIQASEGDSLRIVGENFGESQGTSTVTIGSNPPVPLTVLEGGWSPTAIDVQIPSLGAGYAGSQTVTVTVGGRSDVQNIVIRAWPEEAETVLENTGSSGPTTTAIDVNSEGRPFIAYLGSSDIFYIGKDPLSDEWWQIPDRVDGDGTGYRNLGTTGADLRNLDLDIDAFDVPHICYSENSIGRSTDTACAPGSGTPVPYICQGVRYATNTSVDSIGNWPPSRLFEAIPGSYCNIVSESTGEASTNRVHIGYQVQPNGQNPADRDVRYINRTNGVWGTPPFPTAAGQATTVNQDYGRNLSAAVDASGVVHMSHLLSRTSGVHSLVYTTNLSGSWVNTIVTENANANDGSTSLAVTGSGDTLRVHIAYYYNSDLMYVTFTPTVTNPLANLEGPEVLDGDTTTGPAAVGSYSSMAGDDEGRVHVAYSVAGGNTADLHTSLKYARGNFGDWDRQVVDGSLTSIVVPTYISLAVDNAGGAHISYRALEQGQYSIRYETNGGTPAEESLPEIRAVASETTPVNLCGGTGPVYDGVTSYSYSESEIAFYELNGGASVYAVEYQPGTSLPLESSPCSYTDWDTGVSCTNGTVRCREDDPNTDSDNNYSHWVVCQCPTNECGGIGALADRDAIIENTDCYFYTFFSQEVLDSCVSSLVSIAASDPSFAAPPLGDDCRTSTGVDGTIGCYNEYQAYCVEDVCPGGVPRNACGGCETLIGNLGDACDGGDADLCQGESLQCDSSDPTGNTLSCQEDGSDLGINSCGFFCHPVGPTGVVEELLIFGDGSPLNGTRSSSGDPVCSGVDCVPGGSCTRLNGCEGTFSCGVLDGYEGLSCVCPTVVDLCAGGVVCDDGNTCTDDSCDPASGCVFINNDSCNPITGCVTNSVISSVTSQIPSDTSSVTSKTSSGAPQDCPTPSITPVCSSGTVIVTNAVTGQECCRATFGCDGSFTAADCDLTKMLDPHATGRVVRLLVHGIRDDGSDLQKYFEADLDKMAGGSAEDVLQGALTFDVMDVDYDSMLAAQFVLDEVEERGWGAVSGNTFHPGCFASYGEALFGGANVSKRGTGGVLGAITSLAHCCAWSRLSPTELGFESCSEMTDKLLKCELDSSGRDALVGQAAQLCSLDATALSDGLDEACQILPGMRDLAVEAIASDEENCRQVEENEDERTAWVNVFHALEPDMITSGKASVFMPEVEGFIELGREKGDQSLLLDEETAGVFVSILDSIDYTVYRFNEETYAAIEAILEGVSINEALEQNSEGIGDCLKNSPETDCFANLPLSAWEEEL